MRKKLAYYRAHAHCGSILFVRQDRIRATLYPRTGGFRPVVLAEPDARLDLPEIGFIGKLGQLYRATPRASAA